MSSIKSRSSTLQIFQLYSPVLIAVLIMLPRLLSPQFGLLDDGKSIITAQDIARGDWGFRFDTTDSRLRPLYWVSFAFLYNLAGEQPVWFFLLNTIALCLAVIALISFMIKVGANPWQAWLAGLFFAFSGAVIENFYTLSKGEWLQVLFLAISLVAITRYSPASQYRQKILLIAGAFLMLLLSMLTKETSVVVFPVSAVWAFLGWLWLGRSATRIQTWRIPYLISSITATGAYFLLRYMYTTNAVSTSGYTERYTFTLTQLVSSGIRWAGWLARDYSYLAFVVLLAVILLVLQRGFSQMHLAMDMLIWMAAWIVVYLPWNFMTEYYMLPFTFGAAVLAGLVLGEEAVWRSRLTWTLGILVVILFAITAINNVTSARLQLAVDSVNAQMLEELSELPRNASVLINIQTQNEYTDQIKMQLGARFHRSDLEIGLFNPGAGLPDSCLPGACYIVSPAVQNQPLLTVRMGVFEPTQEDWNGSLQNFLNGNHNWVKKATYNHSFGMLTVDFPRLFCKYVNTRAYCAIPSPFIDMRDFQYGWSLYQLQR